MSCASLAHAESGNPSPGSDATEVSFVNPTTVELSFDHEGIISDALSA